MEGSGFRIEGWSACVTVGLGFSGAKPKTTEALVSQPLSETRSGSLETLDFVY